VPVIFGTTGTERQEERRKTIDPMTAGASGGGTEESAMQWQYRTILFEFTKDGLLGDKYVDDEEMEKTLNQMGGQGWELINVTLLQDGVLGFLKKPVQQERVFEEPMVAASPASPSAQPVIRPRYAAPAQRAPEPAPVPEWYPDPDPESEPEPKIEAGPARTAERVRRIGTRNDDGDFIGGIKIS